MCNVFFMILFEEGFFLFQPGASAQDAISGLPRKRARVPRGMESRICSAWCGLLLALVGIISSGVQAQSGKALTPSI